MRVCIIDSDGGSPSPHLSLSCGSSASLVALPLTQLNCFCCWSKREGGWRRRDLAALFLLSPTPTWIVSSPALWCTVSAFSRAGSSWGLWGNSFKIGKHCWNNVKIFGIFFFHWQNLRAYHFLTPLLDSPLSSSLTSTGSLGSLFVYITGAYFCFPFCGRGSERVRWIRLLADIEIS